MTFFNIHGYEVERVRQKQQLQVIFEQVCQLYLDEETRHFKKSSVTIESYSKNAISTFGHENQGYVLSLIPGKVSAIFDLVFASV